MIDRTYRLSSKRCLGNIPLSSPVMPWSAIAPILALAILLTAPLRLTAQILYGSLTGTITDASEAVLPNAHVTVLETQTGVSESQTTDSAGIIAIQPSCPEHTK